MYWLPTEDIEQSLLREEHPLPSCHIGFCRIVLCNWLWTVRSRYQLRTESILRGIALFDQFMRLYPYKPRSDYQLYGITCFMIASKVEELYPPEVKDWLWISDNLCNKSKLVQSEREVLIACNYSCTFPVAVDYISGDDENTCRLLKAASLSPAVCAFKPSTIARAIQQQSGPCWTLLRHHDQHVMQTYRL